MFLGGLWLDKNKALRIHLSFTNYVFEIEFITTNLEMQQKQSMDWLEVIYYQLIKKKKYENIYYQRQQNN